MNCKIITEGLAKVELTDRLFYNEHMHFCRSLSSLWVGTLPQIENTVDGFCASAIRGIRYKLENKNIKNIKFFDRSQLACETARKNLDINKIEAQVIQSDSNKFFVNETDFDFVEIDPFGSPVPFLDMIFLPDCKQKQKYISISATDTAVLCGAHKDACIKNYFSKPLDNEFCHETGLRILLSHIARSCAKNDWGLQPQFCFSHRHYFKVMLKITKSAIKAKQSVEDSKYYVKYCQNCAYRELSADFPQKTCPHCNKKLSWAGPLWGKEFVDAKVVENMIKLLAQRDYLEQNKTTRFLECIKEEAQAPALYYDIHEICSKFKVELMKNDELVKKLKDAGFFACKTTFRSTAIRTDANVKQIVELMHKRV